MPTVEEDKVITAAARADPDAQPLTPRQLEEMAVSYTHLTLPTSDLV